MLPRRWLVFPITCFLLCILGIEVVIEGDMDEAKANALVQDIRESVEADTGRSCVVKGYR